MGNYTIFYMFENPRRGRQARNFTIKCSENSRSQIVLRTDIFRKLSLGAPDITRDALKLLAVVTLQTFYPGKLDLLTVYLGKLNFLSVTDFSPGNLPRGNFIVWGLVMSREQ